MDLKENIDTALKSTVFICASVLHTNIPTAWYSTECVDVRTTLDFCRLLRCDAKTKFGDIIDVQM